MTVPEIDSRETGSGVESSAFQGVALSSSPRPPLRIYLFLLVLGGLLSGALLSAILVPRGAAEAGVGGWTQPLLAGGSLLMIASLAAVLLISRSLSRDLAAAAKAAQAVAEGRLVSPVRTYVAETHRLHQSLAAAAALLQEHERERERELRRADAARDEADHANRTKDHFLAILGHELRNPLAPAFNAVELMKMRDPTTFKREREILERQIGHMVGLVNDLMDVSRLARGKVHLRPTEFELRAAVDRAVEMTKTLVEQHEHTLSIDVARTGFPLHADQDRIVQVLRNLLTNAAKYTPSGGHIIISARLDGDMACISCEDNGPGVSAELAPVVFDSFAQGPRTLDRRLGGLGLGLTLARNLTELHGGTIAHEDRGAERGSRFIVRLPLSSSLSRPAAAEGAAPRSITALRILVVDDNEDAADVLREGLEVSGHTVWIALDGNAALTVAAETAPEVAVLDIGLPGMDGYELARRLRRAYPLIRLIALTGYGQRSDVDAAVRAGFDAHCTKPVSLATLLEQIERRRSLVA